MKIKETLIKMSACQEAVDWVGEKSIQEAWDTCERGDWMLWFYARYRTDDLKGLTLAKGHIANTVRHLMKDQRSLDAVDTAIAFGEGRVSRDELEAAYAYAADAYADAAAYADAYADAAAKAAAYAAAYSAAKAAYAAADAAAYAAAYAAASDAAYAASDAAYAAYADAYAAYTAASLKQSADICRKYLTL